MIARCGQVATGPYLGQWQVQMLAVDYATSLRAPGDTAAQVAYTQMFSPWWPPNEWYLGALWWEPTYAHNTWVGDQGSLYRPVIGSGSLVAPQSTLATSGSDPRQRL